MNQEDVNGDRSAFDTLPPEQMVHINRCCDQFETLWQNSADASLSNFVDNIQSVDPSAAPILYAELVALDIQYRHQFDHPISIDDYLKRYPTLCREDLEGLNPESVATQHGESNSPSLDSGTRIGDYVIEECIGHGGMGQVYRAHHELMGRVVAIKVMSEKKDGDPLAQRRFEREVRWIAKMSHPNIVTAFDARIAEGRLCLVTEWIDGNDLSKVVASEGPLTALQAMNYAAQSATGLQYAHEQGCIHRDVKPGNLLLDSDGTVKVLDLGLAKLRSGYEDEGSPETLTKSIQIVGTAAFLSPEQASSPDQVDVRSDIYSLGCTLFFLLTGKPPYSGSTALDTLLSHVNHETPTVSSLVNKNEIPDRLNDLITSMMAKRPADRPSSMKVVAAELSQIESSVQVGTQVKRSAPAKRWLLGGSVVSLLIATLVWFLPAERSTPPIPSTPGGLAFDGESGYASVKDFNIPLNGPAMVEVLVTPRPGALPSNVVTWSGERILVLFAGFNQQWGVAFLNDGESHLEVANQRLVFGRKYLLAARWDGASLQLWVDGKQVQTRRMPYPLFPSETALCFGGIPEGLLPSDQGTRFFNGTIHLVRVSTSPLPDPAQNPADLLQQDGSTIALFPMQEGIGGVTVDSTNHHWRATLFDATWEP